MKIFIKILRIISPLFIIVLLLLLIQSVKINEVSCRSQFGECSVLITEKLESLENCNYFECKKNIDKQMSAIWIVDKYSYQLKIPPKLEVNVVEKKPRFSIKGMTDDFVTILDAEGLVLEKRQESNLPGYFTNKNKTNPGETVSSEELFALNLVYGVSKIQNIDYAQIEDEFLNLELSSGERVLLPLDGDRDFILGSLALILNELKKSSPDIKIEGEQIRTIDLRYKNPVLIPQ